MWGISTSFLFQQGRRQVALYLHIAYEVGIQIQIGNAIKYRLEEHNGKIVSAIKIKELYQDLINMSRFRSVRASVNSILFSVTRGAQRIEIGGAQDWSFCYDGGRECPTVGMGAFGANVNNLVQLK